MDDDGAGVCVCVTCPRRRSIFSCFSDDKHTRIVVVVVVNSVVNSLSSSSLKKGKKKETLVISNTHIHLNTLHLQPIRATRA